MKKPIKVPSAGESVTQATVGEWQKQTGDYVAQNEVLVIMETDKASMDLVAEHSGKLNILKPNGTTVKIGEVIAELDTSAKAPGPSKTTSLATNTNSSNTPSPTPSSIVAQQPAPKVAPELSAFDTQKVAQAPSSTPDSASLSILPPLDTAKSQLSPAVRRLIAENKLVAQHIEGTGPKGRITKEDVLSYLKKAPVSDNQSQKESSMQQKPLSEQTRKRMTTIRKRIAERLVASQQNTATLTTFNEIDMSKTISLRKQYKELFQKKHQIKLGFMGFFIKAVVQALQMFPRVNAFIDNDEVVYNHSCHIGVAVSTDKGLVVPVIKHAQNLNLAECEKAVLFYAEKARDGNISPDDLMGGTFTISNGGVFGSLMSTPILNPPQSGILGLHKITPRPIAVDGQIQIKPMMYVALSYDHRMVDGKESVSFLYKVKEFVEDPIRLLVDV